MSADGAGVSDAPWRLLSSLPASGASHMAIDQTMLETACEDAFLPTLRFYRWSPPALSIGRFQPLDDVDLAACDAEGIEVVRRPTGGRSILHLDDFTYSIALPPWFPLPRGVIEAYRMICGGILLALEHLGLEAAIAPGGVDYRRAGGACFSASTEADLVFGGHKLCGSAQVRRSGALLQHGTIMLRDRSRLLFDLLRFEREEERSRALEEYRHRCVPLEATGRDCEWEEVAASFRQGFEEHFGVRVEEGSLSQRESERRDILTRAYSSERWLKNADARALPD